MRLEIDKASRVSRSKGYLQPYVKCAGPMSSAIMRRLFFVAALACIGPSVAAAATGPLTLLRTVPIPGITGGDFDHFAIDERGGRLYVAAEGHHSIETFDRATGNYVGSIGGFTTPHTIVFDARTHQLVVADGGDSSVKFVDGTTHRIVTRLALATPPDAGLLDAATGRFYVARSGRDARRPDSILSVISLASRLVLSETTLPADNLESMALDRAHDRLYVNMRDKDRIGIVGLSPLRFERSFGARGMHRNTPLRFDAASKRLFVAGRVPGRFVAIDATTERTVAVLPSVSTVDDMSYDPLQHRIYVSGAGGLAVYAIRTPDRYRLLATYPTLGGKTSTLDASQRRFYVVHTKTTRILSGLQIFRVNP